MLFRNYTPFPHVLFESCDPQGKDFGVLVLRGTFQIIPNQPLKALEKQEPVVTGDQYFGEPDSSSIWMETNLAPYKPKSDIHINAIAHAPGGTALERWNASVQVGKISKSFQVTGPRNYHRNLGSWQLERPSPTLQVPIRYEQAYGGNSPKTMR